MVANYCLIAGRCNPRKANFLWSYVSMVSAVILQSGFAKFHTSVILNMLLTSNDARPGCLIRTVWKILSHGYHICPRTFFFEDAVDLIRENYTFVLSTGVSFKSTKLPTEIHTLFTYSQRTNASYQKYFTITFHKIEIYTIITHVLPKNYTWIITEQNKLRGILVKSHRYQNKE